MAHPGKPRAVGRVGALKVGSGGLLKVAPPRAATWGISWGTGEQSTSDPQPRDCSARTARPWGGSSGGSRGSGGQPAFSEVLSSPGA